MEITEDTKDEYFSDPPWEAEQQALQCRRGLIRRRPPAGGSGRQTFVFKKIDAVYSSDLIRAVKTAQIANDCWNCRHIIRQELREISFGEMEGMTDDEIARKFHDFKRQQERMEQDLPYPGGECAGDVINRAMPVLEEIAGSGCQNVAVVTHGGVIRTLAAAVLHMEPKDYRLLGNSLENGSITEIRWNEEAGRFFLQRFNDYAHLEPYPELLRASWTDAEN